MIHIRYDVVRSVVTCDGTQERNAVFSLLDKALAIPHEGYFFSERYKLGLWDGHSHFFSSKTGAFNSGLLTKVLALLRGHHLELTGYPAPTETVVTDIKLQDSKLGSITCHDYQVKAVSRILRYSRGVWKIATNGGKTEAVAALLKTLAIPSSLVLIPRRDLLKQTANRLSMRLGVRVGQIGDGVWEPQENGVNVAMFQTLSKKLKNKSVKSWVSNTKVVVADECQFLTDKRYQVAFNASRAEFRLGISGTPWSKNNDVQQHVVTGLCGPVLIDVTNSELISRGISCPCSILYLEPAPINPIQRKLLQKLDFSGALRECEQRNLLIAELARGFLKSGRQTLVMVKRVEHGKAIQEVLPEAVFVHGSSTNRNKVRARLQSGEPFICICTKIFDTGLSVDFIEAMIFAGGGPSDIDLLQALGRGLRKKKHLWAVDFFDSFHEHTRAHSRARFSEIMEQDAFSIVHELQDCIPEVQGAHKFSKGTSGVRL